MKKVTFSNIKEGVKKHGPGISIVAGVVGLVASNVFTFFGTVKSVRKIDEIENELGRETTNKEKIKYCWKHYIPSVTTIVTGASAVIGGDQLKTKRFKKEVAANVAALAVEKANFEDYKDVVKDKLDKKQQEEVQNEYEKKQIERMDEVQPMKYNPDVPMGDDVYCYDPLFNVKFIASQNKIENAANIINRDTTTGSYASLQQFYHNLDIPREDMPDIADEIGWRVGEMLTVYCHEAKIKDGIPRMVIRYNIEPRRGYQDLL